MQKLSFFVIIYAGDFMTFASRERFKERKYSYMKKKELDEENPLLKLGKVIVFSPLLVFGTIGQIIDKNNNKKTINDATKNKINNNVDNNIIITKKNKEYIKENIMSTQEKKSNNNIETEVNNDLNKQSIIIVANDNECLLLEKKIYLKIKKKLDNLNQKIKQIESEEYLISKYADDKNLYNKAKKIQTRIEELQFELTKIEEEYKILSNKNIIKDPLKLDDSLIIDDIVNYRNLINELNYNKIPDKLTLLNTYTILNNKLEDLTNKTKELNKKKSLRVKELQNRDKKYNKAKIKTKNLNEIESDCNKIIEEYINYEKELLKKVNKIDSKNENIIISNLNFGYNEDKTILKNINMTIKEKSFISIVGQSGSGKSTLAGLISLRNENYSGSIKIGEIELSSIDKNDLNKKIVVVDHNGYLFEGNVYENLKMAGENITEERMNEVLKQVGLYDFLQSENGLQTKITEKASNLSGGQKQRLAIARAMLYDGDIYIFDEATSNVDVDSEENIINIIKEISKTKTVILISHRLYNCRFSDIIYFLKDGTIKEEGSHEELIKLNGEYANIYNEQIKLESITKGATENA